MLNTESWISGPHNWLDGRRVRPGDSGLGSFANLSPRTGGLLCEVSSTGEADVDRAVASARAAFPAWSRLSGMERGRLLTRAAAIIRDNLEDIARLDVKDNGKPIWEARFDILGCADTMQYYGGLASSIVGVYCYHK